MKKKFINSLLGRVFVGAVSAVPFVGKNIQDELKDNKNKPAGGKGKVDYPRLVGYIMVGVLFTLKVLEVITWDDLEKFIKIIFKME